MPLRPVTDLTPREVTQIRMLPMFNIHPRFLACMYDLTEADIRRILAHEVWPQVIEHRCDDPLCINALHLRTVLQPPTV